MRRLVLGGVIALAVSLTACGEEADVAFRESGGDGGGASQGIAEGEPAPGTNPDEPTSDQPVDDDGQSVPPGGGVDGGAGDNAGSGSPPGSPGTGGGTSGSTGSAGAGPRTEPGTVATEPAREEPPPGDGGYTEPRPGQEDVRAREWESAHVESGDRTIVITWWSGVEPCTVLDHVDVAEEAGRIVITLYEGSQSGYDGACMAMAVEKKTKVTVSQPVAGRPIVDGAKAKPAA